MGEFVCRYLKEHTVLGMTAITCVVIFVVVFMLYGFPMEAILYPAGLSLLIALISGVVSLRRAYAKHRHLEDINQLTSDTVFSELSGYSGIADEDYQRLLYHLCDEVKRVRTSLTESENERLTYFMVWAHQIKTPLASIRLHLENEDTALARQLMSDLLHIEQYVDMVLTYLRMGSPDTDYVFCEVNIDAMIRDNIRKMRGDFILKKNSLVYSGTKQTAVSDEKWLSFVIGQILSNSLKYTSGGSITISVQEPKTICIQDTGIGIAKEDLPRIGEKGFTGRNGRIDQSASGLGLFLCKQICERLCHSIDITSEPGEGTTVRIDLNREKYIVK